MRREMSKRWLRTGAAGANACAAKAGDRRVPRLALGAGIVRIVKTKLPEEWQ